MRIVAASLPYVAGKFGGSILATGSFHPLRMRQQMLRMGRNSRLYFPGDGRAQSSLSWPSFHHSNTVRVALGQREREDMTKVEMLLGSKNQTSTHQISRTFQFRYIPVCRSSIADTVLLECQQLHSLDRLFEACGIVQTLTNEVLVTFLTSVSNV